MGLKESVESRRGQSTLEYILMIAVVVAATYVLKDPMSTYLTQFFAGFSGRASRTVVKPTGQNYLSNTGTKGCSSVQGGRSGGGASCE